MSAPFTASEVWALLDERARDDVSVTFASVDVERSAKSLAARPAESVSQPARLGSWTTTTGKTCSLLARLDGKAARFSLELDDPAVSCADWRRGRDRWHLGFCERHTSLPFTFDVEPFIPLARHLAAALGTPFPTDLKHARARNDDAPTVSLVHGALAARLYDSSDEDGRSLWATLTGLPEELAFIFNATEHRSGFTTVKVSGASAAVERALEALAEWLDQQAQPDVYDLILAPPAWRERTAATRVGAWVQQTNHAGSIFRWLTQSDGFAIGLGPLIQARRDVIGPLPPGLNTVFLSFDGGTEPLTVSELTRALLGVELGKSVASHGGREHAQRWEVGPWVAQESVRSSSDGHERRFRLQHLDGKLALLGELTWFKRGRGKGTLKLLGPLDETAPVESKLIDFLHATQWSSKVHWRH